MRYVVDKGRLPRSKGIGKPDLGDGMLICLICLPATHGNVLIPNDKIIDGKKVKFTPDEVANDICEKLKLLYSRNVGELMCMANIE